MKLNKSIKPNKLGLPFGLAIVSFSFQVREYKWKACYGAGDSKKLTLRPKKLIWPYRSQALGVVLAVIAQEFTGTNGFGRCPVVRSFGNNDLRSCKFHSIVFARQNQLFTICVHIAAPRIESNKLRIRQTHVNTTIG